ncbi:MAG: hypothetical protein ABIS51_07240 [Sphingomonas sp.]|jgi:hypothetical protein
MQRQLAIAASAARHPFRQYLVAARFIERRRRKDDQDLRLFAMSFTAFFICIYTFIF